MSGSRSDDGSIPDRPDQGRASTAEQAGCAHAQHPRQRVFQFGDAAHVRDALLLQLREPVLECLDGLDAHLVELPLKAFVVLPQLSAQRLNRGHDA